MSDLFWAGDERAGELLTEQAWLAAMVRVEQAWLDAIAARRIAPGSVALTGLVGPADIDGIARGAESTGTPVLPLVTLLRERADAAAARWIHRGLTSQDVVDTGLMLCLRAVVERLRAELRAQIEAMTGLIALHRHTVMAGRTLTQYAVPITFGLKVSGWLTGVLDAADAVDRVRLPAQVGGAAGTRSAIADLAGGAAEAADLIIAATRLLGLEQALPWHTARAAVTALGDAMVRCTDAWGHIATDVLTLSRPEIAELAEPDAPGRGGSSTMPGKRNPVLSVLIRRAAIAAPPLASTLHLAASLAGDERSDGAWHTEWASLRTLGRRTVVAAAQTTELLTGLRVDTDRMSATAAGSWSTLTAEQRSIAAFTGADAPQDDYLGSTQTVIDDVLARAAALLDSTR
ncbi:lyase family protein [Nocardia sp. NPDC019304]|uniref:lyase family protein n=1 Tax=unclassified Nocardia TaxID=2637762 RepID=UPI0033D102CD